MRARLQRTDDRASITMPLSFVDQAGLGEEVELEIQGTTLVIQPIDARAGWAEAAEACHAAGDDKIAEEWDHLAGEHWG